MSPSTDQRLFHYGFTGTRKGMTKEQREFFERYLISVPKGIWAVHHGDCQGADADMHVLLRAHGGIKIIGHPPENTKLRAYCDFDEELPPAPFLDRNKEIVNTSDMLFAVPSGFREELRSGTWSTIRYAQEHGVPVRIVYPDGRTEVRAYHVP